MCVCVQKLLNRERKYVLGEKESEWEEAQR